VVVVLPLEERGNISMKPIVTILTQDKNSILTTVARPPTSYSTLTTMDHSIYVVIEAITETEHGYGPEIIPTPKDGSLNIEDMVPTDYILIATGQDVSILTQEIELILFGDAIMEVIKDGDLSVLPDSMTTGTISEPNIPILEAIPTTFVWPFPTDIILNQIFVTRAITINFSTWDNTPVTSTLSDPTDIVDISITAVLTFTPTTTDLTPTTLTIWDSLSDVIADGTEWLTNIPVIVSILKLMASLVTISPELAAPATFLITTPSILHVRIAQMEFPTPQLLIFLTELKLLLNKELATATTVTDTAILFTEQVVTQETKDNSGSFPLNQKEASKCIFTTLI
jgi:hypothetical protein